MQNVIRFYSDTGIEVPAVSAEQMREIDQIAIGDTGPNLYQMMENAGRNLASFVMETVPGGIETARVLVLAGSGGNGGGGICAARHLANHGLSVALRVPDENRLGEVSAYQLKVYRSTQGQNITVRDLQGSSFDLIIDALIGYGLNSAPSGPVAELICWANRSGAPTLSLDIPSGINATTGATPGDFIRANWTLTLALPKTGLSPQNAGELFLGDIGIPIAVFHRVGLSYTPPFRGKYRARLHAHFS